MTIKLLNKKQLSNILILLIVLLLMFFQFSTKHKSVINYVHDTKLIIATKTDNNESLLVKTKSKRKTVETIISINSFKGSHVDGIINIDDYGIVIVDHDLKRLFDYFFTATGELTLIQIKDQIKLFANNQLNSSQLYQLLNVFDQYSKYLNSYEKFAQMLSADLSQAQRLALISIFRKDILGYEMAHSFFAEEESYIQFVLSDKQTQDGEWTDQQHNWLVSENNATAYLDTIDENDHFIESETLSTTQVYDYRTEQYGRQAAQRLALLDIEREQWQQIVSDYNQQRQMIETNQSDFTLVQLHDQYSDQDRRRLNGLWRVAQ